MGTSLVVQRLRLRASSAGDAGSIPGRGTKIPHAARHGQNKKLKTSVHQSLLSRKWKDDPQSQRKYL